MSSYPPQQACPRCRYPLAPGMNICPNCGLPLSSAPGAGAVPPAAPGGENFGAQQFADPYTFSLGNQPAPGAQQPGPSGSFPTAPTTPAQPGPSGGFSTVSANPVQPDAPAGSSTVYSPQAQPGPSGGFASVPGNPQQGFSGGFPQPGPSGTLSAFPGTPAGVSNPPPGFASPVASYPGTPTAYPGMPGQPGFGGPFAPGPGMAPPKPSHRGRNIALILLILLLVLGGAGGITYALTRPKPVITVTSQYTSGSTPAGSASTTLNVRGSKFSANSTITFLLDGQPVPGNQTALSNDDGAFSAKLKITEDWSAGKHTLTARDAGGYKTEAGQPIVIVNQGEAGTPGPNGAPADNTELFTLRVTLEVQGAAGSSETLTVTGQPDPAGGTVCNKSRDDGQPHSGTASDGQGGTLTETTTWKCSGTYKSGKITYTETITSDKVVFSSGRTCTLVAPVDYQKITGSFTDATHAEGDFSSDAAIFTCDQDGGIVVPPQSGTWTGTSS